MNREDRVAALFVILVILVFLGIGLFFSEGIADPDVLVGRWETQDGKESLLIVKESVADMGKFKIHTFIVHGNGKSIYIDDFSKPSPDTTQRKCVGVMEIYSHARSAAFGIKWEEPVSHMTAFELQGRLRLSLCTYPVKEYLPNPGIRFYKVNP